MTDSLSATRLGSEVPRRGNRFSFNLARLILWINGWQVVGTPPNARRFVISAAPHTSNWDGFHFLVVAAYLGVDVRWVAKQSLFKGLLGKLLLFMGGVPVDRAAAGGLVPAIVEQFRNHDQLALVIAPEGTRGATDLWKSGFHRIARSAGVPIACGFLDYRTKRAGFGPTFEAEADLRLTLDKMTAFYQTITPKHPENFLLPRAEPESDD